MLATKEAFRAVKTGVDFASLRLLFWLALPIVGLPVHVAHTYPASVRSACKHDYKRLCPHYEPGTSKMRSCMRASISGIAPRCYDTLIRHGYAERRRAINAR